VVTSRACFGFDDATRKMTLVGILDGLTVESVLAEMELTPLVADRVETLPPPTDRELGILREEIDPARTVLGRP
jgi:glutaconate CoA-transferase subunit B